MSLIKFKNLPDTTTPLNAENLNNNFSYTVPVGGIVEFAGSKAPDGWLLCNGQAISRTTYKNLFDIIGTIFGTGDNKTTFNLPNRNGRVGVGVDVNDADFNAIGKTFGEKKHTQTIEELAEHNHEVNYGATTFDSTGSGYEPQQTSGSKTFNYLAVDKTGGNKPFNVVQPSLVMNYIIKY